LADKDFFFFKKQHGAGDWCDSLSGSPVKRISDYLGFNPVSHCYKLELCWAFNRTKAS